MSSPLPVHLPLQVMSHKCESSSTSPGRLQNGHDLSLEARLEDDADGWTDPSYKPLFSCCDYAGQIASMSTRHLQRSRSQLVTPCVCMDASTNIIPRYASYMRKLFQVPSLAQFDTTCYLVFLRLRKWIRFCHHHKNEDTQRIRIDPITNYRFASCVQLRLARQPSHQCLLLHPSRPPSRTLPATAAIKQFHDSGHHLNVLGGKPQPSASFQDRSRLTNSLTS